jgi:PAS domain S-box-containing protein
MSDTGRMRLRVEEAEALLRKHEERLQLAIDAGQLGIWDWDIVHDRVTWSDRVYELHGLERGSFGGRVADFAALVHPADLAQVQAGITAALAGGPPYSIEFRVPLREGGLRWLSTRAEVIRDPDGKPVRMVGATYDITERMVLRRRLELLAHAGEVLSGSLEPAATLQTIASIIVPEVADWCRIDLIDQHGVMQRALTYHSDPDKSRYGTELVARLKASPVTKGSMSWVAEHGKPHLARFDPPLDYDPARDRDLLAFAEAIGMRSYYIVPLIARGKTLGALGALQAESGRPITDDDRTLIEQLAQRAALAIDNARLFADAQRALKEAETANRSKDEFLAMLGHELRNPLAPIVTALHVMKLRGDHASDERHIIERQVTHLSRLVDDLLDVSRITKGKIQLERGLVNVKAVITRALELTQPALDRRARPIDLQLPQEPLFVAGDAVRLVQVVCNLLTNAVKFTPRDASIALRLTSSDGHAEIIVADQGNGIAPALLPHVFDLFVQGEQSIDRRAGGLGLGLAIVRNLVQMHGGTVRAVSEGVGKGATFIVRLPTVTGAATMISDAPEPEQLRQGSGRILIVDDNADAAQTLELLLTTAGYDVRTAPDAERTFELLQSFTPHLAILDIGLPTMNGYELAERLRGDARLAGVRLVALTGYGRDRDRERALASRFDEHLVKPVAPARLLEVIGALVTFRS